MIYYKNIQNMVIQSFLILLQQFENGNLNTNIYRNRFVRFKFDEDMTT